jgi:hypothetical protein
MLQRHTAPDKPGMTSLQYKLSGVVDYTGNPISNSFRYPSPPLCMIHVYFNCDVIRYLQWPLPVLRFTLPYLFLFCGGRSKCGTRVATVGKLHTYTLQTSPGRYKTARYDRKKRIQPATKLTSDTRPKISQSHIISKRLVIWLYGEHTLLGSWQSLSCSRNNPPIIQPDVLSPSP